MKTKYSLQNSTLSDTVNSPSLQPLILIYLKPVMVKRHAWGCTRCSRNPGSSLHADTPLGSATASAGPQDRRRVGVGEAVEINTYKKKRKKKEKRRGEERRGKERKGKEKRREEKRKKEINTYRENKLEALASCTQHATCLPHTPGQVTKSPSSTRSFQSHT